MVLNFISCLLIIKSWLLHPGSSSFPYAVIVVRSSQIPTGLRRFIKSLLASRCVLTGYHHTIHHITGGNKYIHESIHKSNGYKAWGNPDPTPLLPPATPTRSIAINHPINPINRDHLDVTSGWHQSFRDLSGDQTINRPPERVPRRGRGLR